jgi:hypothetical protein
MGGRGHQRRRAVSQVEWVEVWEEESESELERPRNHQPASSVTQFEQPHHRQPTVSVTESVSSSGSMSTVRLREMTQAERHNARPEPNFYRPFAARTPSPEPYNSRREQRNPLVDRSGQGYRRQGRAAGGHRSGSGRGR